MSLRSVASDFVKARFANAGLSVGWYPGPGTYERLVQRLFQQREINCVVDIGGFNGTYAQKLRALRYQGLIISFEPVPSSYALLQEKMKADPLWVGKPYGLSDESRTATIKTYAKGDFNSLLNLSVDAEKAYNLNASERSEVDIELRRLDEVLGDLTASVPYPLRIFAKIDTQGHDRQVLQGASGVLELICGFQSELPAVQIYDGMLSMSGLLEYYSQIGFTPVGFYPVNTFSESLVSPEFDVVFTRFGGTLSSAQ